MSMQPRPATCRPPVSASVPDAPVYNCRVSQTHDRPRARVIWINALEEEEPRRPAYHAPLPAEINVRRDARIRREATGAISGDMSGAGQTALTFGI
jgi:hypothetical protein